MKKDKPAATLTEKCIVCQVDTYLPVNTPIDQRNFYVEGSGQLCQKCWDEIYHTDTEQGC